jgi:hypothetical protein
MRDAGAPLGGRQMIKTKADIIGDREPRQMPIFSCGAVMVTPSSCTRPCVGLSRPDTARSKVDLPQPEPPTITRISPGTTESDTFSSACTLFG